MSTDIKQALMLAAAQQSVSIAITGSDTVEFSQFTNTDACREYTLPRDEKLSDLKGSIRGNFKIGPVLDIATCYLQGKHGVEISIKSFNKDNTQSWIRISHGSNKFVINLNINDKKFQKFNSKNMRWNWMQVILQADQRPKQNNKNEILPALPQELASWVKNLDRYWTWRIFNLWLWSRRK